MVKCWIWFILCTLSWVIRIIKSEKNIWFFNSLFPNHCTVEGWCSVKTETGRMLFAACSSIIFKSFQSDSFRQIFTCRQHSAGKWQGGSVSTPNVQDLNIRHGGICSWYNHFHTFSLYLSKNASLQSFE